MSINLRIKVMENVSRYVHWVRFYRYRMQGYTNIHRSVILESDLTLDKVCPNKIHIGRNTLVASRATILSCTGSA